MKHVLLVSATILAAGLAIGVNAESDCKDDGSTVVSLNAEARRVVQQDRVQVSLNIEYSGKTPQEVQNYINGKMQQAKGMADKVNNVKFVTAGYNVYKQYPPEPGPRPLTAEQREKGVYWQGSQSLTLDGADKDDVMKLMGAMQQLGFSAQGLNFYLSREAGDKLKDDLLAEALTTIRARAERMGSQLGLRNIRYARIDMNGGGYQPPMYARAEKMMAMAGASADMAEPVAQGGESDVTMTVTAEVRLSK